MDAKGGLGKLPLFAAGTWQFPLGSHQRLRLVEPRYQEMIERALAPGGDRRFALVLCPSAFEEGARGRICDIVESERTPEGEWHVVVEGGAAFQVLEVSTEELQPDEPPLHHGVLEEIDEEEIASLEEAWTPLAAANEMVNILSILGRHLGTMRRRRRPLTAEAFVLSDDEDPSVGIERELREAEDRLFSAEAAPVFPQPQVLPAPLPAVPAPVAAAPVIHMAARPRPPGWRPPLDAIGGEAAEAPEVIAGEAGGDSAQGEHEDVGAMVNLLMAYRQIITEMDRLLVQASRTAERLGIGNDSGPAPEPAPLAALSPAATAPAADRRPTSSWAREVSSLDADALARPFAGPGGGGGASMPASAFPREPATGSTAGPPANSVATPTVGSLLARQAPPSASSSSSQPLRNVADASAQTAQPGMPSFEEPATPLRSSLGSSIGAGSHWPPPGSPTVRATASISAARAVTAQATAVPHGRATTAQANVAAGRRPSTTTARSSSTPTVRPSTPSRMPSTPSRVPTRSVRTASAAPIEDRPLTQAEALQLRSGTDWRSAFSFPDGGGGAFSMSETPSSSTRRGSSRRPRQAVFSQAARFTFPGRWSGTE